MTTYVFPTGQTYFCFDSYAKNFRIVHTCVSLQNTNPHDMFSDNHKNFTFVIYHPLNIPHLLATFVLTVMTFLLQFTNITSGKHISSFTSMTLMLPC